MQVFMYIINNEYPVFFRRLGFCGHGYKLWF
jgi:hypothetical protein